MCAREKERERGGGAKGKQGEEVKGDSVGLPFKDKVSARRVQQTFRVTVHAILVILVTEHLRQQVLTFFLNLLGTLLLQTRRHFRGESSGLGGHLPRTARTTLLNDVAWE